MTVQATQPPAAKTAAKIGEWTDGMIAAKIGEWTDGMIAAKTGEWIGGMIAVKTGGKMPHPPPPKIHPPTEAD